jgi:hypothetical protein
MARRQDVKVCRKAQVPDTGARIVRLNRNSAFLLSRFTKVFEAADAALQIAAAQHRSETGIP